MLLKRTMTLLLASFLIVAGNADAQEKMMAPPGATPELMNMYNQAAGLVNSGKFAEAAEKLKNVTRALPDFAQGHAALGMALGKMGKNAESMAEMEKAAALTPNDPILLVNLGQMYQLTGKSEKALETYKKYLAVHPNGQYAGYISMRIKTLQTEVNRRQGQSSEGLDNYFNETMAQGGGRWDLAQTPIKVCIADGSAVESYKPEFKSILENSFRAWEEAAGSKLKFAFVASPAQAQINCKWTSNLKDLLNPLEGGQALAFQTKQGTIMKADIMILTRNPSLPTFPESYLRHVCLHEVGHALGLAGHSSQPGDVMFASVNYEAATGMMSDRDKKTIKMLYGQ